MLPKAQLAADLAVVRGARILFSHHSVGANVLSGVEGIDLEVGGGRVRVASADSAPVDGPALVHVSGGRNGDPASKLDFFAATLRSWRGAEPQLALMKLCYVDIGPSTDVVALLDLYATSIDAAKREHPRIRFAHVTVPLVRRPTNLKASLRRWLGLGVWEDESNVRRNEFNRLLRERFPSDPVFDLAQAESRAPDGTATRFSAHGREYLSLYPGYTDDGGHLNAFGRRVAGGAAIRFLASALAR